MSRRDVWKFNLFPAYRGTGGRLVFIADDWSEVRIKLRLTWRTRNYVGTLFGGSLYGAVDPLYMVMLMHRLGPEYVVWDKSAAIRFRRPGRGTLYATFRIDDEELDAIRTAVAVDGKVDRIYIVELVDAEGVVCAAVEKTIYIARRDESNRRPGSDP